MRARPPMVRIYSRNELIVWRLLSSRCTWSRLPGSNRLPPRYKGGALPVELRRHGAEDGTRTRCILLGRQALDQMSFIRMCKV